MTAQTIHLQVTSETQRNKKYDVFLTKEGWKCSCPHFVFRNQECKHIVVAKQTIESDKVKEATA